MVHDASFRYITSDYLSQFIKNTHCSSNKTVLLLTGTSTVLTYCIIHLLARPHLYYAHHPHMPHTCKFQVLLSGVLFRAVKTIISPTVAVLRHRMAHFPFYSNLAKKEMAIEKEVLEDITILHREPPQFVYSIGPVVPSSGSCCRKIK
ncbi:hypothetical protein BJY52DRAFT_564454 [Lactarius psammicola]|nr:hypothetical protein BJY52DRAFT_564454 [Lactarius psammicola]